MYVYIILIPHCSLYPQEKQLFTPLARYRYDGDALGGDEASGDRSDDGNDSASTDDGNDVDLFSKIAVDEESDYGIDTCDIGKTTIHSTCSISLRW
jgi:hypothetical protein